MLEHHQLMKSPPTLMLAPLDAIQRNPFLNQFPKRTQLPQERHPLLHRLQHVVNFALRREPANPEPDAAVSALVAATQGSEYITWF